MSEIEDCVKDTVDKSGDWPLNSWIAGLVAITATLMAIGNIKDGNIVQAMTQVQAKAVDSWNYYQSKSLKQLMSENAAQQLRTYLDVTPLMSAAGRAEVEKRIARFESESKRYEMEKADIKKQAEGFEKQYDNLNVHDDQFDMAEAFFTVSIALYGVTALTRKKWLFYFACTMASLGLLLETAGFMQLKLHPEWLAKLLG